jgi:hypothetical protein
LQPSHFCFARRHGAVGLKQNHMLNAVSWQQYIIAIITCCGAWYAYVSLRFYQPRLQAFLKIKSKSDTIMPPVATKAKAVMGPISPDADTVAYESDELIFGNSTPDDISDQTLPKGPADDLLFEAQTLITAYEDNDDKSGFLSLLKVLLSKYEVFADEISLPAIVNSLKQTAQIKLPFPLKDTEWPLNF